METRHQVGHRGMEVGRPARFAGISSLTPRLGLRSPSSTSSLALETWLFSSIILVTSILLLCQFLGLTIPFSRGLHNLGFFPLETSFRNLLLAPLVGPGRLICWVTHPLPRLLPPCPFHCPPWGSPAPFTALQGPALPEHLPFLREARQKLTFFCPLWQNEKATFRFVLQHSVDS